MSEVVVKLPRASRAEFRKLDSLEEICADRFLSVHLKKIILSGETSWSCHWQWDAGWNDQKVAERVMEAMLIESPGEADYSKLPIHGGHISGFRERTKRKSAFDSPQPLPDASKAPPSAVVGPLFSAPVPLEQRMSEMEANIARMDDRMDRMMALMEKAFGA